MHHWIPLLDHFDAYLEKHVKGRRDLELTYPPTPAAAADPAAASSTAAAAQQQQQQAGDAAAAAAAEVVAADPPFPSQAVLQVLRVTTLILEGCSNKHLYNSYEVGALCGAVVQAEMQLWLGAGQCGLHQAPTQPRRAACSCVVWCGVRRCVVGALWRGRCRAPLLGGEPGGHRVERGEGRGGNVAR